MCDCDCGQPEVYEESERRARKPHRCCECRRIINPGELYMTAFGVWFGDAERYSWCSDCESLKDTFREATKGDCVCFGQLYEECEESGILCRVRRREDFLEIEREQADG